MSNTKKTGGVDVAAMIAEIAQNHDSITINVYINTQPDEQEVSNDSSEPIDDMPDDRWLLKLEELFFPNKHKQMYGASSAGGGGSSYLLGTNTPP